MPTMTKDVEGNKKMIESLEEASALVGNFLADEYSATLDEGVRPNLQVLPNRNFEWLEDGVIGPC